MGEAAHRILDEAVFFTGRPAPPRPTGFLRHEEPLSFGPFTVTPLLADHSGYDAYSLLVEAEARRLFYTGDLRAHGRKGALFERLLGRPPPDIDVLLMEGTHVREGASSETGLRTERDVEEACVELFRSTGGMVLVQYSPQNVDRLVTLFKAARRSGREFVMDLYATSPAAATGRTTIPHAGWDGVRVYLPHAQRRKVIEAAEFDRTDRVRAARVYPEQLAARPGEFVMTFRQSMARELAKAKCLEDARAIWSLWPGYLEGPSGQKTRSWLAEREIPLTVEHASGHASVRDLQRLVEALAPERVVPIHSFASDRFPDFFPRVDSRPDGEWWEI
jgi:ribonuclease J